MKLDDMEFDKASAPIKILLLVAGNEKTNSHQWYEETMKATMKAIIISAMQFEADDFTDISKGFSSCYWIGQSHNGKHYGDYFYSLGCKYNESFCRAYENHTGREPFIIGTFRMNENSVFKWEGKYWFVSGWDDTNKILHTVGYDNFGRSGKRKLEKFDRKRWLELRKSFERVEN